MREFKTLTACAVCHRCTVRFATRLTRHVDCGDRIGRRHRQSTRLRSTGDVLSGGNFHGAPLSYAFDYAAIALTDLASICERRIDRLINPDINEGLPPFLSSEAGLSSGYMMAHVAAAALLNECKVLAHPASVDSVPTSGGKEDHVSMG